MSIQKKSLISTLKTTKKANVASAPAADGTVKGDKSVRMAVVPGKGANRFSGGRAQRTSGGRAQRTSGGRHHNQ